VVIHADCQAVTAFQPAPLQNLAPIGGFHALPETVNADAVADFGLICSLWHATSLSKDNFNEP
jgi:hypothetical protein